MPIQEGWREQYDRMRRSHSRILNSARGDGVSDSASARDELFHFFQDAYHLKDWLRNDPEIELDPQVIEDAVNESLALRICCDLCNGTKHRVLTRARSGDIATAIVSQAVTIHVGSYVKSVATEGAGSWIGEPADHPFAARMVLGPPGFISHAWAVESMGVRYDALVLADLILEAWDSWLAGHQLMSRGTPS